MPDPKNPPARDLPPADPPAPPKPTVCGYCGVKGEMHMVGCPASLPKHPGCRKTDCPACTFRNVCDRKRAQ